jgi:hypothetical protein
MKKIIFLALPLIAFNAAHGGIEWKYKELPVEIQRGQASIEMSFPFTITGGDSVGIISTKTSCSCTTVDSGILGEHKPGTDGALKVRYVPNPNAAGTMLEKITVSTTDPKAPEVELRLLVYSTLAYRIEPNHALWNIGADPDAKDLRFTDLSGKGYKPVLIYSSSVNFTATLIPPEGKSSRYIIRIKPMSTKEADGAHVYLDVDMGDGTIEKRRILAAIRDQNDTKIKIK